MHPKVYYIICSLLTVPVLFAYTYFSKIYQFFRVYLPRTSYIPTNHNHAVNFLNYLEFSKSYQSDFSQNTDDWECLEPTVLNTQMFVKTKRASKWGA